jgi:hypothetical protein
LAEEKEAAKVMAEALETKERYVEQIDASMKAMQDNMSQIEVYT